MDVIPDITSIGSYRNVLNERRFKDTKNRAASYIPISGDHPDVHAVITALVLP